MSVKLDPRRLCAAALLLAVGLLLPQVFHMVGGRAAGSVFSPMHLPVLVCGLLLGPFWGCGVGLLTPLLSSLLMSMPPLALMPFMVCELAVYGLTTGLLTDRLSLYPALIAAQVAGRVAYALALFVGGTLLGVPCAAPASVLASVVTGLPGIVLQLVLVPLVVTLVRRAVPRLAE